MRGLRRFVCWKWVCSVENNPSSTRPCRHMQNTDRSLLWVGNGRWFAFLKIEDSLDIFHRLEKYFSFKQRLNNFAKITTGILNESFVSEKSFDKSLDYPGWNENITVIMFSKTGEIGKQRPLSSNVEFEAMIEAKIFASSNVDVMTSVPIFLHLSPVEFTSAFLLPWQI